MTIAPCGALMVSIVPAASGLRRKRSQCVAGSLLLGLLAGAIADLHDADR